MSKHIHAEAMLQYAQDAMETDKPWERWEIFVHADEYGDDRWSDCGYHPPWNEGGKYRRKPRTININGHEVPEPEQTPPARHAKYYIPDIKFPELHDGVYWESDTIDYYRLKIGTVHLSKDAAIVHARALLSFTTKPEVSDE